MAFLDETGLAKVRDWIKGKFVQTVNGQAIDSNGNVSIDVGVTSVNGINANADGNVTLECVASTANTNIDFRRNDWDYGYYLPINTAGGWRKVATFTTTNHIVFPNGAEFWIE